MDPITIVMVGLTGVLFVCAIAMSIWWALLGLYDCARWLTDCVRGLIGIRLMCAREDRTMGTVSRMRVRGQA